MLNRTQSIILEMCQYIADIQADGQISFEDHILLYRMSQGAVSCLPLKFKPNYQSPLEEVKWSVKTGD